MIPKPFHDRIQTALGDPQLQAALDANARRRTGGQALALDILSDPQELRRQAHAVRAATIADLDHHLARFIARARANGLVVHQAADASQAAQIVIDLARQRQARLVAKSKSMVTEEIDLNHALQAAGLEVVETDLGEYIVQLRGERPAHIITPAVHLNRRQVGQTFHEKLGIPLTVDVPNLTAAARRQLRQVFQQADLGISGVNFGVAETGTLCIVTNEGNGRMVTTLPPVHVAVMGMERLVPGMDDLVLMLQLLPKVSTGQNITVYVNLIHSPRRPQDPDGPQERHLILVDNGRQAMRHSPLAEALMCIRCGACLNACPIFREIGGHGYVGRQGQLTPYSGPIGSIVAPGQFGQAEFGHLARASTLCGACQDACPVDIPLPKLLLRTRAGGRQIQDAPREISGRLAWGLRLYAWLATSPRRFAAAQRLGAALGRLWSPRDEWMRLPYFTGWGRSRRLPRPAWRPFRARYRSHPAEKAPSPPPPVEENGEGSTPDPSPRPQQDLLAEFTDAATQLGATVIPCHEKDLAGRILAILQNRNVDEILAWEAGALPDGLLAELESAGIDVRRPSSGERLQDPLPPVGLTGAVAGVAETGSLLLTGGPDRPLSVSLLPAVHLAVVRVGDLHASLQQVFHLPEVRKASSAVLISGPSRTADIEMTLTVGVHGPGELQILCLGDEPTAGVSRPASGAASH